MTLNDFMLSEIFTFLLIFCRIGSAMMILPGFGEAYISMRVRLFLALTVSLVLTPVMRDFPAPPGTISALIGIMAAEILTGLFLGTVTRFLLAAISTAGMIIAYQSSLASALVQDVTVVGSQGSTLGNLLGIAALALIFATDLHHLMLRALADSYLVFRVGQFPDISDFTQHAIRTLNDSFLLALQIAAPHIVIGLIIYLAGGIIGRLMPTFQVFFVLVPAQLTLSFFVLMSAFGSIMIWYLDYFGDHVAMFVK